MRVRLGVNTCFAVKRWPRPEDWAPLVRDRLGLGVAQHSLDLVDLERGPASGADQAAEVREAVETAGLELHSTFTGLAAYSRNLLLSPDGRERMAAEAWLERAIRFTTAVGGAGTGGHVG
ncbi:MAG TPA: sugar phosphate isomerase/epimerase, partial [Candidatus Dormibacteraeota bacterium]|nr:sugar phosphate isomerase/epimerase [Candidatus Dormibacteraeota bacterium]